MAADLPLLIKRMEDRASRLSVGSPEMNVAMNRIGLLIKNQTVINITKKSDRANGIRKGLIKFGSLRESINFKVFSDEGKSSVVVGSFGIPYAAIHEFGFKGLVAVRNHLRRGANVRAHQRMMNVPARPYLRPAITKHKDLIINILRAAVKL